MQSGFRENFVIAKFYVTDPLVHASRRLSFGMRIVVAWLLSAGLTTSYPLNSNKTSVLICLNSSEIAEANPHMHSTVAFTENTTAACSDSEDMVPVVEATFVDSISTIGQGRLVIKTVENNAATDGDFFYATGFAEGYLTAKRVVQQVFNVIWSKPKQNAHVYDFLVSQYTFMRENAMKQWKTDPFWFQVSLTLARLDGLTDGIKKRQREVADSISRKGSKAAMKDIDDTIWPFYLLTYMDLYGLNSVSEMDEIIAAFARDDPRFFPDRYTDDDQNEIPSAQLTSDLRLNPFELAENSKCSALVKLVHADDRDAIDLIASHNTWTDYGEMLRIFKSFNFEHVTHKSFANRRISMSSYPGYLSSTDDWVVLPDSNLLVTETTNECISKSRLRKYVVPDSVTTNVRSIVASLMSSSGSEWFDWFSRENSGTYNNQWILVDFGRFDQWKRSGDIHMPSDVLWIGEQAPGLIISKDMTEHLFETSYWASYNRPYFAEIANVSGYTAASKLKGEWFHHQKCPRARMFTALHSAVQDIETMKSIMTLNRWDTMNATYLHTHNCPKNQIAGRYDVDAHLDENSEDYKKCGPVMAYGALDCKITDTAMMMRDEVLMMSGPAWNNTVPAFNWTELPGFAQAAHWGHPELWNFGFVRWVGTLLEWTSGGTVDRLIKLPRFVIGKKTELPEISLDIVM